MIARGSKGATIQPDMAIHEINPDFFDCVLVVGGPGSVALSEDQGVINLLIEANKREKIVGAICLGPLSLAKAGILANKNATVYPEPPAIRTIRDNAAIYVKEPVVIDGKIITADGPGSAGKFGTEIVKLLKGKTF